jgi:hypothetical protein
MLGLWRVCPRTSYNPYGGLQRGDRTEDPYFAIRSPRRSVPADDGGPTGKLCFLGSYAFKLEREDGTPAEGCCAELASRGRDRIGRGPVARVIDSRLREDSEGEPVMVLVVEPA